MRASGSFHQAACAFTGGGAASGVPNRNCVGRAQPCTADDHHQQQQQHVLRAPSRSSRSSLAVLQHFLQAASNTVGLPSSYGGNVVGLSRSRGRSRTCGGVAKAPHGTLQVETAVDGGDGTGAAAHTNEEGYGAPAVAGRLRWARFGGTREGEEAGPAGQHQIYGYGEGHAVDMHPYWCEAPGVAEGEEEACVKYYELLPNAVQTKRYGDGGEIKQFESGGSSCMRPPPPPLFSAAPPAAVGGGLDLTEYASGQLTVSLDPVTSAGGYVVGGGGGGAYAASGSSMAAAAAAAGVGGANAVAAAGGGGGGRFSGCCAAPQSGPEVPHPGTSCWAPPSDIFSKGEYAAVPEVRTSASAAQTGSQPSGGGCWCSSRAAAAARREGTAEPRKDNRYEDEEVDQDEDDNDEEPQSERNSPVAALRYPAAAMHLQLEEHQLATQRRQRPAGRRVAHLREGNGRAAFRRHSAVSYYAGIFAAAASAASAATGHSPGGNEDDPCFPASGLQQHKSQDSLMRNINRAHSAAASLQRSNAASTQMPFCMRGGNAVSAAHSQREQVVEGLASYSLASQHADTHPLQCCGEPLQQQQHHPLQHGASAREQLLLHQQSAPDQLLQQQLAHDQQAMLLQHHQQLSIADHEHQQHSEAALSDNQRLYQARDCHVQQQSTVEFWKSTVGSPSSACLALRHQKQQLMLLHEQLLQHSKLASSHQQQKQRPLHRLKEKSLRSRDRRNSCCDCRPHRSCARCRNCFPRVLEEGEEAGASEALDPAEGKAAAADAGNADHNSFCVQEQILLVRRQGAAHGSQGKTETADEQRNDKEGGSEEASEHSPARQGDDTSEAEDEAEAAVRGTTSGEEGGGARAAVPYVHSPLEIPARRRIASSQICQPTVSFHEGTRGSADPAEDNEEGSAARLFASPFKLGSNRRRPSDAGACAAAAVASAAASSSSLPPRPRSGVFLSHSTFYGICAGAAAAVPAASVGGCSSNFGSQQHVGGNEGDEGGAETPNSVSAQERDESMPGKVCTKQKTMQRTCKREHHGIDNVSPSSDALAAAISRKLLVGRRGGESRGETAEAAENEEVGARCAGAAAPHPADSSWACSSSDVPPSAPRRSPDAGGPTAGGRKSGPTTGSHVSAAAENSLISKKSTLWAPSSLLKTLTRGLQQHSAGPSMTNRRSSSTIMSTTAAAAPLSGFCSSSSCSRRVSVLSSSGAPASAGGAAAGTQALLEVAPGSSSSSAAGIGAAAAATGTQHRESRHQPSAAPRSSAEGAPPLTRSYSAGMYRGPANNMQNCCSSSCKSRQSSNPTGGYGSFSSLARVLRPRRHSHHQGEAGRRAAAAAAAVAPLLQRPTEGDLCRESAECLKVRQEQSHKTVEEVEATRKSGTVVGAGQCKAEASSITSAAYVGEEESNRNQRKAGEAATASSSPRRAATSTGVAAGSRTGEAGAGAASRAAGEPVRGASSAFHGVVAAVPVSGRHVPRLLRDAGVCVTATERQGDTKRSQPQSLAAQTIRGFNEDCNSGKPAEEEETEVRTAAVLAGADDGAPEGSAHHDTEKTCPRHGACRGEVLQQHHQHQQHSNRGLLHVGFRDVATCADQEKQPHLSLSLHASTTVRRAHTAPSRGGLGMRRKAAADLTFLNGERRATRRAPSAAAAIAAGDSATPAVNTVAASGGDDAVAAAAEKDDEREEAKDERLRMGIAVPLRGVGGGLAAAAAAAEDVSSEKPLPALLHQQQQLADIACSHQQQLKPATNAAYKELRVQPEEIAEKHAAGIEEEPANGSVERYVTAATASRVTSGKSMQTFRAQQVPAAMEQKQQHVVTRPSQPCVQKQEQQRVLALEQGRQQHLNGTMRPQPAQASAAPLQHRQQHHTIQQQHKSAKHTSEEAGHMNNDHGVQYDIEFGGMLVKLHRKLSSKCHCQFDVWESEAVGFVKQQQKQPTNVAEGHADTVAGGGGGQDMPEAAPTGSHQSREYNKANIGSAGGICGDSNYNNGDGIDGREKGGEGAQEVVGAHAAGTVETRGGAGAAGGGAAENLKKNDGFPRSKEFEAAATIVEDMSLLGALHMSIVGLGRRFALKVLEVDNCEGSKLKYKTHSVLQEGKQLRDLCVQLRRSGAAAAIQTLSTCPSSNTVKLAQQRLLLLQLQHEPQPLKHPEVYVQQLDPRAAPLPPLPIPRYFWTGWGVKREDGSRILGVSMEQIEGQPLTQILQQLRVPTKKSAALLTLEISIKFVRAQAILSSRAALDRPIINWDTKPGNVLVELQRSPSTQQLHCLRCVIIDLGDALPGPTYAFPTRHQAGMSPSYVICTKGYCSPECAILVFMLSAVSKSSAFRRVWYGTEISAQAMLAARKERFEKRWRAWVQQGYLRKVSPPRPALSACETSSCGALRPQSAAGTAGLAAVKSTSAAAGGASTGRKDPTAAESTGLSRPDDQEGEAKERRIAQAPGESVSGQKCQQGSGSGGSGGGHSNSGYWEVVLSDRSVVFSTGLIIGQLFGGPSLLQVVNRDEVAALDILCEWGCTSAPNLLLNRENLHSEALLPTQGVFAAEPWRDRVKTMLRHTLAFLPGERWSFQELERFLLKLHADLASTPDITPVEAKPRESGGNCSSSSTNHSWGLHRRHSPAAPASDAHNSVHKNISLRRADCPQAAPAPF